MAGGTVTVTGLAAGLLTGQKTIGPLTMTGTVPIGEMRDVAVGDGDLNIGVPDGATAVVIVIPTGVTVGLRTNLNADDAGTPLGAGWAAFAVAAGVVTIILNAATEVGGLELTFI